MGGRGRCTAYAPPPPWFFALYSKYHYTTHTWKSWPCKTFCVGCTHEKKNHFFLFYPLSEQCKIGIWKPAMFERVKKAKKERVGERERLFLFKNIAVAWTGSLSLHKLYYQKMRFTPIFNYYNILGWILFVYRAK